MIARKIRLQIGDLHMVAFGSPLWPFAEEAASLDIIDAFVQPLVRRPFVGISLAFIALAAPSDFIPGGGEGILKCSSCSCGGGKGPLMFSVLSIKFEDCFVFSYLLTALYFPLGHSFLKKVPRKLF
jgi:hypothetical protein